MLSSFFQYLRWDFRRKLPQFPDDLPAASFGLCCNSWALFPVDSDNVEEMKGLLGLGAIPFDRRPTYDIVRHYKGSGDDGHRIIVTKVSYFQQIADRRHEFMVVDYEDRSRAQDGVSCANYLILERWDSSLPLGRTMGTLPAGIILMADVTKYKRCVAARSIHRVRLQLTHSQWPYV